MSCTCVRVCVCALVVVFLGLLLTYSFSLGHIFPYLPGFLAYVSSENKVHPTPLVQRIKFHAKMAINQGSHTHIFFGEEANHYSTLHNFRRSKKSKWSPHHILPTLRKCTGCTRMAHIISSIWMGHSLNALHSPPFPAVVRGLRPLPGTVGT